MRFALLGNDPDGLQMTCALVQSGRHLLAAYTTSLAEEVRKRFNADARLVRDTEEVLADPGVGCVVVAGPATVRAEQLRRVLQSERHALCVRPAELSVENAYEASLMQGDVGRVLLPLMPAALHPGIRRLAAFVVREGMAGPEMDTVGLFLLLEVEIEMTGEVLVAPATSRPALPGWDVLRALGGEIDEVFAFAEQEELRPGGVVLTAGRFAKGGLFRMTLLPGRPSPGMRFTVVGGRSTAELYLPLGWEGPAFLSWAEPNAERHEESWETWDPWPALVEVFEAALAGQPPEETHVPQMLREAIATAPAAPRAALQVPANKGPLSWQDAVRSRELDDAARRSIARRRASALEYPEATEEASFKGTMTLVGCSIVWIVLLLVFVSAWVPAAKYVIVILLVVFLVLQLLRYALPGRPGPAPEKKDSGAGPP
jgi:predicted dehydrogenase